MCHFTQWSLDELYRYRQDLMRFARLHALLYGFSADCRGSANTALYHEKMNRRVYLVHEDLAQVSASAHLLISTLNIHLPQGTQTPYANKVLLAFFKYSFYCGEDSIFRRLHSLVVDFPGLGAEPVFKAWREQAPLNGYFTCSAMVCALNVKIFPRSSFLRTAAWCD
jgi:hypothetical protein